MKHQRTKFLTLAFSCIVCVLVAVFLSKSSGAFDAYIALKHSPASTSPSDSTQNPGTTPSTSPTKPIQKIDTTPDVTPAPNFSRPSEMKGVWLVPGKDYYLSEEDTGETVKAQIDEAFAKMEEWSFNTLIIPTWHEGKTLFENSASFEEVVIKNEDGSRFFLFDYLISQAKDKGIFTYGVINLGMNNLSKMGYLGIDPTLKKDKDKILTSVNDAVKISFDGFMISGIGYNEGRVASYQNYIDNNPGVGFEKYMFDSVTGLADSVKKIVKNKNSDAYIGLYSPPVWANISDDLRGSDTSGLYSLKTDGYGDSLQWIHDGLFDFIMLDNPLSTLDEDPSFSTILTWWDSVCREAEIPLYLSHSSDQALAAERNWSSPDQLTKQLLECKEAKGWKGSVFNSFASLSADDSGSTNAVLTFFEGRINVDLIKKDLVIVHPTSSESTTEESVYSIRGNADIHFDLTMNGEKVTLSELGDFAIPINLEIGKNTFVLEHKGESTTIIVNYRYVVLKSISPVDDITVDGKSILGVTAVARNGADVSAALGGSAITLKETKLTSEENEFDASSEFSHFYGEFTLPAGSTSGTTDVGSITVSATASGVTNSKTGSFVTLKKEEPIIVKPDDEVKPPPAPPEPNENEPSGFLSAGGVIIENAKIAIMKDNYVQTFDGNTADYIGRPTNSYLPKGTYDVLLKSVGSEFYLLNYGKRVYKESVTVEENSSIKANALQSRFVGAENGEVYMRIGTAWKVPFKAQLFPVNYYDAENGRYGITSFTANYIDFNFSYTMTVSGGFDMTDNPLFSKAEWIKGNDNTYTLRLHLRRAGGFYGYSAVWNDKTGNLDLTFQNPDQSLSGKQIVIDPGHGGSSTGTSGGTAGGILSEKVAVLDYSLKLKAELESRGATVILTRDGDYLPFGTNDLYVRTGFAHNNGSDLFISVHMDSFIDSSVKGYTLFYYNEYSMAFAKSVNNHVSSVYTSFSGGSGRGYRQDYYAVTRLSDCPSLLIECGFMSNVDDLALLKSTEFRDALMKGIADGMEDYFASLETVQPQTQATTSSSSSATEVTETAAPVRFDAQTDNKKRSVFQIV